RAGTAASGEADGQRREGVSASDDWRRHSLSLLQVENKRSVTICAGVGQSGKSTFAFRYLINGDFTARFIFDPEGEAAQRLQLAPARDVYELGLALCNG